MGFFDKLRRMFAGAPSSSDAGDPYGIWFHFRCNRCGAVVRVRADRRNDLNREDGPGTFLLRKDVMDSKCFRMMTAEIWLDDNYNIVSSEVEGGKLIPKEEYEAAQTR